MTVSGYIRTDKGNIRAINEDNFCVNRFFKEQEDDKSEYYFLRKKHVMIGVFDGIGGEDSGEIASFIAAKTLARFNGRLPRHDWNIPLDEMNHRINSFAKNRMHCDMGSTASMAIIHNGYAEICNLGDSRIYLFSSGELIQISKDHTELQRALDMNIEGFNPETSKINKHSLTKYLGTDTAALNPHVLTGIELKVGDMMLMCSDGLTDMLADDEIKEHLQSGKNFKAIVDDLMEHALSNGGKDNITVAVITCDKAEPRRLFG